MDDWRLMGQEKVLSNVELKKMDKKYIQSKSVLWHEHCMFCTDKITNEYGKDAYATLDEYYWICEECFNDFKEKFKWTVKE
ncbi:MAG TPA: hypothetical protein DCY93_01330 [Firmicutes bacterium]|nr:hypothetical protein [Bacillota bacterium]